MEQEYHTVTLKSKFKIIFKYFMGSDFWLHIQQKVTDTKSGLSEENKTSKIRSPNKTKKPIGITPDRLKF